MARIHTCANPDGTLIHQQAEGRIVVHINDPVADIVYLEIEDTSPSAGKAGRTLGHLECKRTELKNLLFPGMME